MLCGCSAQHQCCRLTGVKLASKAAFLASCRYGIPQLGVVQVLHSGQALRMTYRQSTLCNDSYKGKLECVPSGASSRAHCCM